MEVEFLCDEETIARVLLPAPPPIGAIVSFRDVEGRKRDFVVEKVYYTFHQPNYLPQYALSLTTVQMAAL